MRHRLLPPAALLFALVGLGCPDAAVGPYEYVPCVTLVSMNAIGAEARDLDRGPEPYGGTMIGYEYPEIASRAGVRGDVIVRFFVDEQGAVHDAYVVRGIGAGCDEQAVRFVRAGHYAPALRTGQATGAHAEAVLRFDLVCERAT